MPLLLLDPHNYVRCLRCDRVFIPTYISPATATVRCPSCNVSSRLPSTHPPPPPSPTPINIEDEDFGEDLESLSDEDEDEDEDDFDTTVDWTAEADQYEPNPAPAATDFINSLNSEKSAVTLDVLKQAPSCAICSDEFKLEESVNQMPCDHWFHSDCIVTWLKRKNNCPLCRHEFPREPDHRDHMVQSPAPENPTAATRWGDSSVRRGQVNLIVDLRIYRRPQDM